MSYNFGITIISLSLPTLFFLAAEPSAVKAGKKDRMASLPVAISYVNGEGVYVKCPGVKNAVCWAPKKNISDVTISPEGNALAFTLYSSKVDSKKHAPARRIAVLDSQGIAPRILESIPGENSYGPIWSPDAKSLMFNHLSGAKWEVGLINRDDSAFRIITSPLSDDPIISCAFWANDSKSLYVYDSSNLYQIGLDGKELNRVPFLEWSISLMTTGGKMALSPNGSKFLIETVVDTHKQDDLLSSSPIVYVCDLKTKQKLTITSQHGEISRPSWLPDGNTLLFSSVGKKRTDIYCKDLTTGRESLLLSNASAPSLSGRVQP
jgi:TolB protein